LELGIPYLFALHSRAQLGTAWRLLLALVPSLHHDAFQARLMGLQTLLSGPGLGRNQDLDLEPHMENIWEKHGTIGGNQIYWDVMGFEKTKNKPREM